MIRIFILIILLCFNANAQEVITSYDNNTIPVLNEELRNTRSLIKQNETAIIPIIRGGTGSALTGLAQGSILTVDSTGTKFTTLAIGSSGQYLSNDGTVLLWQTIPLSDYKLLNPTYSVGTYIDKENLTHRQYANVRSQWYTVPNINHTFTRSGTVTIYWEACEFSDDGTSYVQLAINGTRVGPQRTASSCTPDGLSLGYTGYSSNHTVAIGDVVSIQGYLQAGSQNDYIHAKNLRIYCSEPNLNTSYYNLKYYRGDGLPLSTFGSVGDLYYNISEPTILYMKFNSTTWYKVTFTS